MTDEQTLAPAASDDVMDDTLSDEVVYETKTEPKTDEKPEAADDTTGQDDTPPAEGDEKPPEDKPSASKLRRERRRAEMDRLKSETEVTQAKLSEAQQKLERIETAAQNTQPPKEADFIDYQEFLMASAAYKSVEMLDNREKSGAQSEAETQRQQIADLEKQTVTEAQIMFEEACVEAETRYTDFQQIARNPNLQISVPMADVIRGLDAGADVLYHLGKHPAKSAQLAQMAPMQAAVEIGKIEAGLAKPRPIQTSNAPEPIKPVRGGSPVGKAPGEMSMSEYVKYRGNK